MKTIRAKKLKANAILPTRGHPDDAGLDLYASELVGYKATDKVVLVPTSIAMPIDKGFVGLIRDRSSVSKTGMKVSAGVIDAGYTGEHNIVFLNVFGDTGHFKQGQKVAQLLVLPIVTPEVVEVTELEDTVRGTGGFGSTGG